MRYRDHTKSSQPPNLLISITSSLFSYLAALAVHLSPCTLARPPTSSSLRVTDLSFRRDLPFLLHQLSLPLSVNLIPVCRSLTHLSTMCLSQPLLLIHHSHHPHLTHSATPDLKPNRFTNSSHHRLSSQSPLRTAYISYHPDRFLGDRL